MGESWRNRPRPHYVCWRYEEALRRQSRALLERAMAIEAEYGIAPPPEQEARLVRLLQRDTAIVEFLEDAKRNGGFVAALLPAWEEDPSRFAEGC